MASLENRANILGDVRAENDRQMLDQAFFEWQDYKILFEADDRFVVVGRRGTGKSALTYRLQKEWREKNTSSLWLHRTRKMSSACVPLHRDLVQLLLA
ncbi:hypothetical protein [Burkholderia ubonensis]|uniref:hypothetical protein n=1 Tax=Burkholderia ubonensis TaxID=101571 RepID=UPI0012F7CE49|nr:hypothetical protein [Burkholderia ubonensis]